MEIFAPVLVLLVGIGLLAGFLAGLLGVGGGIVLVPAFFYAFTALGFDGPGVMQICLATSLATIVVTTARSMQSHHAKGSVDFAILRAWAPGIACGAILGVLVASRLSSTALQVVFGVLGGGIGLYMAFGKKSWVVAQSLPLRGWAWGQSTVLGLLSVLLGIGGGSLGVPTMTLQGVAIHRAVGTATGFGLAIAVPSTLAWALVAVDDPQLPYSIGAISVPAFAIIIPLTFLMAPVGAKVAHRMDPGPLKRTFGVFLLLVALNMLREAIWT